MPILYELGLFAAPGTMGASWLHATARLAAEALSATSGRNRRRVIGMV
jgi:hypothetical protein